MMKQINRSPGRGCSWHFQNCSNESSRNARPAILPSILRSNLHQARGVLATLTRRRSPGFRSVLIRARCMPAQMPMSLHQRNFLLPNVSAFMSRDQFAVHDILNVRLAHKMVTHVLRIAPCHCWSYYERGCHSQQDAAGVARLRKSRDQCKATGFGYSQLAVRTVAESPLVLVSIACLTL